MAGLIRFPAAQLGDRVHGGNPQCVPFAITGCLLTRGAAELFRTDGVAKHRYHRLVRCCPKVIRSYHDLPLSCVARMTCAADWKVR